MKKALPQQEHQARQMGMGYGRSGFFGGRGRGGRGGRGGECLPLVLTNGKMFKNILVFLFQKSENVDY